LADRGGAPSRPSRARLPRYWQRWAAAAGLTCLWALFVNGSGSLLGGTILLVMIAAGGGVLVLALRFLGIDRDHPWVQRLAERPWRDGREVLQLALRHLPEVFIVTPSRTLLAPNAVELRLNPADLAALTEMMDIELLNSSATEVYAEHITAHAAVLAGAGRAEVSVIGDPAVPLGRYRLRQGQPASLVQPVGVAEPARPAQPAGPAPSAGTFRIPAYRGRTQPDFAAAQAMGTDGVTVTAVAPLPVLRLVTRGHVAETRTSGARAGRGIDAELGLPAEPTVSRLHAEFSFADGRWYVTNLGRNGLALNGTPLTSEHALHDGDTIGWGRQPGAMVSRVEIGWDRPLPTSTQD
jgi:FHA domain